LETKNKKYLAMARISVDVTTEIEASNLTEAAQKAVSLKEDDFITIDGEYLDGCIEITGVYES
jgi:hypothetical protein